MSSPSITSAVTDIFNKRLTAINISELPPEVTHYMEICRNAVTERNACATDAKNTKFALTLAGTTELAISHARERDISKERINPWSLYIQLPESFQTHAPDLAACNPFDFNGHSICLTKSTTYLGWGCHRINSADSSQALKPLEIWIDAYACHKEAHWYPQEDWDGEKYVPRWQPVFMLAGDIMALGGFWVDDNLLAGLQGAGICSGPNYNPYVIYSEQEIERAREIAENTGTTPWYEKVWKTADADVLGVPLFGLVQKG